MVPVLWTKCPLLGMSRANVPADIPGRGSGILPWTVCGHAFTLMHQHRHTSVTLDHCVSACSTHISQCCGFMFSSTSQITVSLCSLLQGDYERPLRDGSPQVTGGDTYPRGPLKQPQSHAKPPGYPPAHLPYPPVFHHYKPSPYHHPPSQPSPPYTPQVPYARCVNSYK